MSDIPPNSKTLEKISDIPPDIIQPILSYLPVKSLLRFRCVSKSWCSLIDSKDFARLHLRHSSTTNSNATIIVDTHRLYFVDLHSFDLLDVGRTRFETHNVVCSCDGLLLVVSDEDPGNITLWNPATRVVNKLPPPPLKTFDSYGVNFVQYGSAMGYDSKGADYKVVLVIQAYSKPGTALTFSETMIYSLKANSWKRAMKLPYVLPYNKLWGVYLSDALHSVVKRGENSEVIMAFHLGTEEHYELPMPISSSRGLSNVEVMGECLAAVISGKKNTSEVWVMKEYGVKDSWVKLFCYNPPIPIPCRNLYPLAYSKNGDKVLLNYEGICLNWFNLKNNTVTIACANGLSASFDTTAHEPPFQALFCVGSLVSPRSAAVVGKENGKGIVKNRDGIPPEIIQDILTRLPVKTLLRFRCVSKSWCSWIDSKDFIQLHLHHSAKTKSGRTLLMDPNASHLFCIELERFRRVDVGTSKFHSFVLECTCNGLALLRSGPDTIVLWNPFSRKMNTLPTAPTAYPFLELTFLSLGYDSKHGDFKVVSVVQSCAHEGIELRPLETNIYSLNSNSWRRVENFPYLVPNDRRWGVYTNDALHTVVKHAHNGEVIMAFDLVKEKHYEVPIPELSTGKALSTVEVMGELLTGIVLGNDYIGEIWVMKEYGVKDSWMKLLHFQSPTDFSVVTPLALSVTEDEILLNYESRCLTWYNHKIETDTLTRLRGLLMEMVAVDFDPPFYAEVCVPSLVSPHSPAGVATGGQGKKGKRIKKERDDFLSVGFKLKL